MVLTVVGGLLFVAGCVVIALFTAAMNKAEATEEAAFYLAVIAAGAAMQYGGVLALISR